MKPYAVLLCGASVGTAVTYVGQGLGRPSAGVVALGALAAFTAVVYLYERLVLASLCR